MITKLVSTVALIFSLLLSIHAHACSMYKLTANGKTMVGCNEDNWRITPRLWFTNAKNTGEYGIAFTGSRQVGENRFAPQSGMNEAGLVYSRLASTHPVEDRDLSGKKAVQNEVQFFTQIMHQCSTVEEVRAFADQYDRTMFLGDVVIFVDRAGDYLVMEPYELLMGNDAHHVLSNFCPSITDETYWRKLERYRNGEDYLSSQPLQSTVDFCRSVSDTMHVCRERVGDGTLQTTIWDTQEGIFNLYFYHDFEHTVQFDLQSELAKGDRMIDVTELFPENEEFNVLGNYVTPFNTPALRVVLVIVAGVLALLLLLYLIRIMVNRRAKENNVVLWVFGLFNIILIGYLFVMATNIGVYYFDAPMHHHSSQWISWSSYVPFLLAILIVPLFYLTSHFVKKRKPSKIKRYVAFNAFTYLLLLCGFWYWGLIAV